MPSALIMTVPTKAIDLKTVSEVFELAIIGHIESVIEFRRSV